MTDTITQSESTAADDIVAVVLRHDTRYTPVGDYRYYGEDGRGKTFDFVHVARADFDRKSIGDIYVMRHDVTGLMPLESYFGLADAPPRKKPRRTSAPVALGADATGLPTM